MRWPGPAVKMMARHALACLCPRLIDCNKSLICPWCRGLDMFQHGDTGDGHGWLQRGRPCTCCWSNATRWRNVQAPCKIWSCKNSSFLGAGESRWWDAQCPNRSMYIRGVSPVWWHVASVKPTSTLMEGVYDDPDAHVPAVQQEREISLRSCLLRGFIDCTQICGFIRQ